MGTLPSVSCNWMARNMVCFYLQIMVQIIKPEIAGEFPNLQRKAIFKCETLQLYT